MVIYMIAEAEFRAFTIDIVKVRIFQHSCYCFYKLSKVTS